MTSFFLKVPSFSKTTRCSTDVYRGCLGNQIKQRFKGACPVCAVDSKLTSRKGVLLVEKYSLGQKNPPNFSKSFATTACCSKETKDYYNYALHRPGEFWFRLWIVIFFTIIDNINIIYISLWPHWIFMCKKWQWRHYWVTMMNYFNYCRKQRPYSKLGPHCDAAVQTYIKSLCLDQKSANYSTQSHKGKDSSTHGAHPGRDEPGQCVYCQDFNKLTVCPNHKQHFFSPNETGYHLLLFSFLKGHIAYFLVAWGKFYNSSIIILSFPFLLQNYNEVIMTSGVRVFIPSLAHFMWFWPKEKLKAKCILSGLNPR